ncbi:17397_t:CDS:2, partial [Racocetra fulgida]
VRIYTSSRKRRHKKKSISIRDSPGQTGTPEKNITTERNTENDIKDPSPDQVPSNSHTDAGHENDVNEKTVNATSGNEIRPAHEETKKKIPLSFSKSRRNHMRAKDITLKSSQG